MAGPVTLEEARAFLREASAEDDGILTNLLVAARDIVGAETGTDMAAADQPEALRQAVLLMLASLHAARLGEPSQVASEYARLIQPYRTVRL